jgi:hypothetical protein
MQVVLAALDRDEPVEPQASDRLPLAHASSGFSSTNFFVTRRPSRATRRHVVYYVGRRRVLRRVVWERLQTTRDDA